MESIEDHRVEAPRRTPFIRKLCYGVGHVLNDLCASMWFSYLLVYFHSVASFSNQMAGYVMLIGQVSDGICTPFIGYEADRTSGICGYGKRKSWHLLGTLCVMLSFPFVFNPCIECGHAYQWAKLIYYAPFVVIFQFGWAATQISHLSLIPDITPHESERVELNAIRYSFTVISNVIVYGITWFLVDLHSSREMASTITAADAPRFTELTFIVVGIGIVFSLIFHLGTREVPVTDEDELRINVEKRGRMTWSCWFKNQQFYLIAILYMGTRLANNMSQVYLPIYLTDSLNLPKAFIAIIPLVVFVSSFCASLLMKPVNAFIGRKATYFIGAVIVLGACVWLFFIGERGPGRTRLDVFGAAVCLGVGCSTLLVTSLSMTADLIAHNTESGAFVYGAMSLCDKLSNGLGVVLVQQLHPCSHCCTNCSWYYVYVISFFTGGATVMSLVALLFLLPQTIGERNNGSRVVPVGYDESTVPILPTETVERRPGAPASPRESPVHQYGAINADDSSISD